MADIIDAIDDAAEVRNVMRMKRRNPQVFRERQDPFELYSEREFRNRYRLSKETARFVIGLVEARLVSPVARDNDTTPALQVLITLRFYAKGSYQIELGDLHGVSQPTVSRIVARISSEIAALQPRFISFPEKTDDLKSEFYNIARFPHVVGCIDCIQVPIKNPSQEQALLYRNRKGFYSLNVQVVCDAQRRILDIVASWRGSTQDARIWDGCSLKDEFEASRMQGILLGDSSYPCEPYLLTAFLNPRTRPQERYNNAQRKTHLTIERCFAEWKGMFKALKNGMQVALPTAETAIVAMAVLFNIRKERGDDEYDYDSLSAECDEDDEVEDEDEDEQHLPVPIHSAGEKFRRNFVQSHFK